MAPVRMPNARVYAEPWNEEDTSRSVFVQTNTGCVVLRPPEEEIAILEIEIRELEERIALLQHEIVEVQNRIDALNSFRDFIFILV